jgi:hypothetical protein
MCITHWVKVSNINKKVPLLFMILFRVSFDRVSFDRVSFDKFKMNLNSCDI